MIPNKILIVAIMATSMLAGCASRPRQQLSENMYYDYALHYIWLSKCGASGQMDPELASFGLSRLRGTLSNYSYDPARMGAILRERESANPTQEDCNKFAMSIHDVKRQVATNQQNSAIQQQQLQSILNNSPKQTYCNKIAQSVFCQTY